MFSTNKREIFLIQSFMTLKKNSITKHKERKMQNLFVSFFISFFQYLFHSPFLSLSLYLFNSSLFLYFILCPLVHFLTYLLPYFYLSFCCLTSTFFSSLFLSSLNDLQFVHISVSPFQDFIHFLVFLNFTF